MIVLLLIGVGLIVAPLSMSMVSRSSDGQKMVNGFGFRPIMQPASVSRSRRRRPEITTPCHGILLSSRPNACLRAAHRGMGHRFAPQLGYD